MASVWTLVAWAALGGAVGAGVRVAADSRWPAVTFTGRRTVPAWLASARLRCDAGCARWLQHRRHGTASASDISAAEQRNAVDGDELVEPQSAALLMLTFEVEKWPAAIFVANLAGAFALGLLAALRIRFDWGVAAAGVIESGFLGGLTTFSTLCVGTVKLWHAGARRTAGAYFLTSTLVGVALAAAGWAMGSIGSTHVLT